MMSASTVLENQNDSGVESRRSYLDMCEVAMQGRKKKTECATEIIVVQIEEASEETSNACRRCSVLTPLER